MKRRPKNRGDVYVVIRTDQYCALPHVCGVYFSADRADEVAAAFDQEMFDTGLAGMYFFEVQVTGYYDE